MSQKETLKKLMLELWEREGLVDFYLQETPGLGREDRIVRICDFDDTLFSRETQLQQDKKLSENRGAAGIHMIVDEMGIHDYIDKYYRGVDFPHDIFNLMDPETDLILTAGLRELQYMKTEAVGLLDFPTTVIYDGKDKILETLRYIVFELGFIPTEIIVYEDRPDYFIQYRELLEGILGCKLTIMLVEMNGNKGYKKIEEV
jgi:hypothetical protein